MFYLAWRFVRRGTGAIHRAASRGDVARIEQLLLASPQAATAKDLMGLLPLEYAAYWGQIEAAEVLLARGAEVNEGRGWTPLHYAAAQDRPEMVACSSPTEPTSTPRARATIRRRCTRPQSRIDRTCCES